MKKFYDRISVQESGRWLWLGAYGGHYGYIVIDGKTWLVHRFSYTLHCDDIPEGMQVLHKCDNGFCVNPQRLFLGSQQDNMTDKVNKNRQAKGSANGNSKLKEVDVIAIKKLLLTENVSQKEIAQIFDVDPKTITNIKLNRQWRHVNV